MLLFNQFKASYIKTFILKYIIQLELKVTLSLKVNLIVFENQLKYKNRNFILFRYPNFIFQASYNRI